MICGEKLKAGRNREKKTDRQGIEPTIGSQNCGREVLCLSGLISCLSSDLKEVLQYIFKLKQKLSLV
jgi:hypothetical protein